MPSSLKSINIAAWSPMNDGLCVKWHLHQVDKTALKWFQLVRLGEIWA